MDDWQWIKKTGNQISIPYILWVVWMLFVSDSMLFSLNNNRLLMNYARLCLIAVGMVCFVLVCVNNHFLINRWLFLFLASMVVTAIFYKNTWYVMISKMAVVFVGFYAATMMNTRKLIRCYIGLMNIIAVISLLGYLFPSFFLSLPLPRIMTSTRQNVFACAFLTNIPEQSWNQSRNWGPFWEPGAFEAFLNINIFFILFTSEMSNRKKLLAVLINAAAIVTTLSTTGLIALPFFLIAYLFKNQNGNEGFFPKFLVFLMLMGALVYVLGDSGVFQNNVIQKLQNTDTSRYLFPKYGLYAGMKNPVFGLGGQADKVIAEYNGGVSLSSTNTIIAHFVRFGLYAAVYYVYQNYLMLKSIVRRNRLCFLLCLSGLIILLCGEYYMYSPMFSFLMFYRYEEEAL